MELQKPYAGTLQYQPRTTLDDSKIKLLRQRMKEAGLVREPENPTIVIDWYMVERDSNRTPVKQTYMVLFRDGGDAEAPGVIFYRKDVHRQKNSTVESFHIPDAQLAGAWKWWEDTTGQKLALLNDYAEGIVNTPQAWKPL